MQRKHLFIPALLCLVLLIILSACASVGQNNPPSANTGAATATPQPTDTPATSTPGLTPTPAPATPTPGLTPTPAPATPTPELTQQYTFTAQDSGKTVRYVITSRFSISLDGHFYPSQNLQLSCTPQDVLGALTGIPPTAQSSYTVRYQANDTGTCTVKNGNFHLTVIIIQ